MAKKVDRWTESWKFKVYSARLPVFGKLCLAARISDTNQATLGRHKQPRQVETDPARPIANAPNIGRWITPSGQEGENEESGLPGPRCHALQL